MVAATQCGGGASASGSVARRVERYKEYATIDEAMDDGVFGYTPKKNKTVIKTSYKARKTAENRR